MEKVFELNREALEIFQANGNFTAENTFIFFKIDQFSMKAAVKVIKS